MDIPLLFTILLFGDICVHIIKQYYVILWSSYDHTILWLHEDSCDFCWFWPYIPILWVKQFSSEATLQWLKYLDHFIYSGMIICPNFIEQIQKHWSNDSEKNKPLDVMILDLFGQCQSSQEVLLNSKLIDKILGLSREMEDEKGIILNRLAFISLKAVIYSCLS